MIGERLAEARKDRGLTQKVLAERLNVSKYTVSSWEQNNSNPPLEVLKLLCSELGVSADELLSIPVQTTFDLSKYVPCELIPQAKEFIGQYLRFMNYQVATGFYKSPLRKNDM